VTPDTQPVWEDSLEGVGELAPETEPQWGDEPFPSSSESEPWPPAQEREARPTEQLSSVDSSVSRLPEPEEDEPPSRLDTAPRPATRTLAKPATKPLESPPVKGPAARPEPVPPKASASGWAVQVGSFSDRANADRLVEDLLAARYPAFQEQTEVGGKTLYRVRVGPEEDRGLADAMAAGIAKRFKLSGRVVSYP